MTDFIKIIKITLFFFLLNNPSNAEIKIAYFDLDYILSNTNISKKLFTNLNNSEKLKIEELISKFELDAVRKVEAKFLSGGMKRRLVISMSLLGEPEILLMDEPLAALDPQTIQMLQTIIIKLQSEYNLTILITDHQARDLLVVCDKAVILSNSKIVAEGTPNELMKNENATKYYFGDNNQVLNLDFLLLFCWGLNCFVQAATD